MPCKQCKDGKYKWGNTGECKYATKEACEKANPKNYKEMKNKPTPIGKKSYEEYAKELKEFNLSQVERVELGINDELGKYLKELNTSVYTLEKRTLDAEKELTTVKKAAASVKKNEPVLIKEADNINKTMSALNQVLKEADSAAKALGIKPSDLPNYNSSEDMLMVANKAISEAYRVADNIDSIKLT